MRICEKEVPSSGTRPVFVFDGVDIPKEKRRIFVRKVFLVIYFLHFGSSRKKGTTTKFFLSVKFCMVLRIGRNLLNEPAESDRGHSKRIIRE